MEVAFIFNRAISDNKFLTTSNFNGIEYVHIREYSQSSEGIYSIPTQKGASFTGERWAVFRRIIPKIDQMIHLAKDEPETTYKAHLGRGIYLEINPEFRHVDIRSYFMLDDQITVQATKRGICLSFSQWRILTNLIADLHRKKPYLLSIQPCFEQVGHQELLNNFDCRECVPFSGIRLIIPLTNNDHDDDYKKFANNF
jgi:hypothetical protein